MVSCVSAWFILTLQKWIIDLAMVSKSPMEKKVCSQQSVYLFSPRHLPCKKLYRSNVQPAHFSAVPKDGGMEAQCYPNIKNIILT